MAFGWTVLALPGPGGSIPLANPNSNHCFVTEVFPVTGSTVVVLPGSRGAVTGLSVALATGGTVGNAVQFVSLPGPAGYGVTGIPPGSVTIVDLASAK